MGSKKKSLNDLIQMVKSNPVIYVKYSALTRLVPTMTQIKYNDALDSVWKDISSKLKLPSKQCKKKWWLIKTRYAKLSKLILSGKVSKHIIETHPKTNNLMGGILSFLDPYIKDISDEDIPSAIHEQYNKLFCVTTLDQNSTTAGINTSLAHQNYIKEKTIDRIKLGLESELIIEDHIKAENDDEELNEDGTTEIKTEDKLAIEINISTGIKDNYDPVIDIKDNPSTETKNSLATEFTDDPEAAAIIERPAIEIIHLTDIVDDVEQILPDNPISLSDLNSIVVRDFYNPKTYMTDNEMINFFEVLAKTVSREFSAEKQKILRERINTLLEKETKLDRT